MQISIVTLFPEMFQAVTDFGVCGRAVNNGLLELDFQNPRDFAQDKHRTVDDRPYGGGPGMVMMCEPVTRAIEAAKSRISDQGKAPRVVYLSPQGKKLDQDGVKRFANEPGLVLLCGRYEGIDERIIDSHVDEECSIGDYVISGGELAAMVLIDAVSRMLPGTLGHEDSAAEDSFANGLLDYPHYSRPEKYNEANVPDVLLSGDHKAIRKWRLGQSLVRTWARRPDLLEQLSLDTEQIELLEKYRKEYLEQLKLLKEKKDTGQD